MKVHAYTTQHGSNTIFAKPAKLKGVDTVFSTHRAGHRFEMFPKTSPKGNHFFCYKSSSSHEGATEPETLSHFLCKVVLAELGREKISTKLILTHKTEALPPIDISFLDGLVEKNVNLDDKNYFIDCFCLFDQPDCKSYLLSEECRWSGQLGFEIFHTHRLASNDPKCLAVKKLGIPVIQIKIKDSDFFDFNESILKDMSDEKIENFIEKHKQKLKNAFKKQIYGTLLVNPESREYSEAAEIYLKANEEKILCNQTQLLLDNKTEECCQLEEKHRKLVSQLHSLQSESESLTQKNKSLMIELASLHKLNSQKFWSKLKNLFFR